MGSVQKRPDGKWRARYRDAAGKEHARHFDRKLDAQRWVDGQETAKSRGEWIDPALSRVTVGAWGAEWLAGQVQLKPSTRARYAGVLRMQVLPTWDRVPLKAVTHTDVSRWVAQLLADGLSARTVHKAHRVLSLVLDLAVRDGRLTRNPASGCPARRRPGSSSSRPPRSPRSRMPPAGTGCWCTYSRTAGCGSERRPACGSVTST